MADYYLWIKAFHIIFVIFWCAGLLMMPRFFAYHLQCKTGSQEDKKWQERETRLLRIIMNPAMIIAWILGLALAHIVVEGNEIWFFVKFAFVIAMTVFHMFLARWRRKLALGERVHSEKFYRMMNEIPSFMIIFIVMIVIIKPFS